MKRDSNDSATLKNLPPFCWFTNEELVRAASIIQHRRFPARVFIQRAGNAADGLYTLLSGRVQVLHQDEQGREFIAAIVSANDFFGELGLFSAQSCVATIRSSEPCEALYMPFPFLLECLHENAQATKCMLQEITKRLSAAHLRLRQLALSDVRQRVADVLLENACKTDQARFVQVESQEIAALVGCSREMVSRVMKKMVQQGLVCRRGRRLIIRDQRALSERAGLTAEAKIR